MAVCFFHANYSRFSGGFVGVDVFFVVSGFLIASFISAEIARGTFSLVSFYERRIRRIFPALFNLVLWSVAAALILLTPDDLAQFGKSLVAVTVFVANLFFSQRTDLGGYFSGLSERQPMLHLWSLSVEEQFYLFFPLLMMALHRWMRKWQILILAAVFVATLILGLRSPATNPAPAFFFLIPRVWEFLCGVLLATASLPPLKYRFTRELAGIVGLGLIGYAVTAFDKYTAFPGLNALFPCIGAALLIHAGSSGASCTKALLSLPPLVFVGVLSYSLYLWHWPILVYTKLFLVRHLDNTETAVAIACALLAAFLSFEFVEMPFRRKLSPIGRKQIFGLGAVAGLTSVLIGGALFETGGLPQRYDITTREIILKNSQRKNEEFLLCSNWKREINKLSDIRFCEFGLGENNNVLFWGDSHLGMLGNAIKEIKSEGHLPGSGALLAINPACPIIPNLNWVRNGLHCDDFNKFASLRARADDIGTVFFVFSAWWINTEAMCVMADRRCLRTLPRSEASQYLLENLRSMIQEFRAAGKRVVLGLPFPTYTRSIPDLEIHNTLFATAFGKIKPYDYSSVDLRNQYIALAKDTGADIFDPRASLCDGPACKYQIDGISIYKDAVHIASTQDGIFKADLIKVLSSQP